ncbi:family 16 glycoside hydrolase [Nibricoccus sp. IMCC34717]|uniref:family 16 glycoside hydrolase n=1 Tax=Nibricoccus sp. IMCC34717 TaxID=3034021 RepID=UPI00384A46AC
MKILTFLRILAPIAALNFLAPALPAAEAGLKLGLQCWTYRRYTLAETLDKAQALNINALQAYAGQELGGGLEGTFGPSMTDAQIATLKGWLKARGLSIVSTGVTGADDEAGWKKLIAFAEKLGIRTITTEAPQDMFPMIAGLIKGKNLRIALHNHPVPSRYADPAVSMAAIKDYPQFGICADTGHWTRDGRNPAEVLKNVGARVFELHFKDISEPIKAGHDMPWGTGIGNAAQQIAVLRQLKFDGYAFVEYEHDTAALDAEVGQCAMYFRSAMAADVATLVSGAVPPPGFTRDPAALWRDKWASRSPNWPSPAPLFKPDLSNAEFVPGTWVMDGDTLVAKGTDTMNHNIWSKESYGDFSLSLEFKCEKGTNSGVFLRCSDSADWLNNTMEVQILQGDEGDPKHVVGALFDVQAPTRQLPIEPGTWHRYVITARGSLVDVYLDGEQVIKMDLNQWTAAGKNPDGTANKFSKAYRDMTREGKVGLQYHGMPISFRNILIERL